jgi:hypothetical protein
MNRARLLGRVGVLLAYTGVAVIALLSSELFLNLIVSPTIAETLGFTDGIHTPDPRFGFVFTPRYRGWMRHPDNVFLARLELDPYGFRLPAASAGSKQNVLALGGRSMMFSYGMIDDYALHHEIGASLRIPSTVYNVAWPGFELFRIFHVYRDGLGKDLHPDFAVVAFYQDTIESYAGLPTDFSHFNGTVPSHDQIFRYYEHIALDLPKGYVSLALGQMFYRSVILNKLALRLERMEYRAEHILHRTAAPAVVRPDDRELGAQRFRKFTAYLQAYFGGQDKVLFIFLPGIAWSGLDMTADYYDPLVAALPEGANYLDLNRQFGDQVRANGYIALGHYTRASMSLLGRAIAERINDIQHSSLNPIQ